MDSKRMDSKRMDSKRMDSKRMNGKRVGRTIFGALLGVALLAGSTVGSARAADDDEDVAFDTKILRQILRSIGLRNGSEAGIDYRERSPLVVPPGRNLPAPAAKAATEKQHQAEGEGAHITTMPRKVHPLRTARRAAGAPRSTPFRTRPGAARAGPG